MVKQATEETVMVVTRTCSLCASQEVSPNGQVAHYSPTAMPRSTLCSHCGCRGLVPDAPLVLRIEKKEKPIDWSKDRPRMGRPTKAMIAERQAKSAR
jgi:hypothetical protein